MKNFIPANLAILMSLLFMVPAFSQSTVKTSAGADQNPKINWIDIKDVEAQNSKKQKKVFLDMYTDWCGWCKKMDQSTFINPVIVDYMNRNFYAVKFNAERKDELTFKGKKYVNPNPTGNRASHQLAQTLMNGRMSYPSFVFLDEQLNVITIVPGFRKAPEFEAILNYIGSDAYKSQKWENFDASFKRTATE